MKTAPEETVSPFLNSDLVTAYAGFAWPVVSLTCFLIVVILFRRDFSKVLSRIKIARIAGNEFELEELKRSTEELSEFSEHQETHAEDKEDAQIDDSGEADPTRQPASFAREVRGLLPHPINEMLIEKISDVAETDPAGGVLLAYQELERAIKNVAEAKGIIPESNKHARIKPLARKLSYSLNLPKSFYSALTTFVDYRNRVTHGLQTLDYDREGLYDIAQAGIELLSFVLRIPRDILFVADTHIPLYSDHELSSRIEGFVGIEMIVAAQPGSTGSRIVVPANASLDVRPGSQVSSEWGEMFDIFPVWIKSSSGNGGEQLWPHPVRLFEGRPISVE